MVSLVPSRSSLLAIRLASTRAGGARRSWPDTRGLSGGKRIKSVPRGGQQGGQVGEALLGRHVRRIAPRRPTGRDVGNVGATARAAPTWRGRNSRARA